MTDQEWQLTLDKWDREKVEFNRAFEQECEQRRAQRENWEAQQRTWYAQEKTWSTQRLVSIVIVLQIIAFATLKALGVGG